MAKGSGSDSQDRYKASRDGLRDSVKWLATSLAALAAVVAGGLSFSILPDLTGRDFWISISVGSIIVGSILVAIWYIQGLLITNPFAASRLKSKESLDRREIEPYERELLPSDIRDIDHLYSRYAEAEKTSDTKEVLRLRSVRSKVLSFASYLSLRRRTRSATRTLLVLFFLVSCGMAGLMYIHGRAVNESKGGQSTSVEFDPGSGWSEVAGSLTRVCGDIGQLGQNGGFSAKGVSGIPVEGWWLIEILAPEPCAGLKITIPGEAIVRPIAE